MTDAINLAAVASGLDKPWNPIVIAQVNDQHVKLAKLEGAFIWHTHEAEDELFLVIDGLLDLHFRDHITRLQSGEACLVPRGVEHKPVACPRATVLLFEPASTINTGDQVGDDRTIVPGDLPTIRQ